jgi:tripartite-type tricarboxylate transporter receptor subunit TctC
MRISALTAVLAFIVATTPMTHAQTYPNKPVELVVAFQPGGGVDTMARLFADAAKPYFSQPFIVVNKAGASGSIGLSYVANGEPDGYKVGMVFAELLTLPLMGIGKVSYEDFQPIAKFTTDPSTLTVRADAPWNSVEEFLAYAKSNPGKATISNAGNGSISHISAAALGHRTGVQFNHVPYQGSAPAVQGLMSGQVDATVVNLAVLSPFVKAGKLKTLALMSDKRLSLFEQVPTLKERGIDLSVDVWRGMAVAKGTRKEVVEALRVVANNVIKDPKLQETLKAQNQTLAFENADEFFKTLASQSKQFKEIIPKLDLQN